MQKFYELRNLIEKKKLDEMGDVKYMANPKEVSPDKRAQYIPSINVDQGGSDGYVGRATQARFAGQDLGRKTDKEIQQANWDQAVADNPDLAIYSQAADAARDERKAAQSQELSDVGDVQYDRKLGSGKVTAKIGTDRNSVLAQLQGDPTSMTVWKNIIDNKDYWGQTIPRRTLNTIMRDEFGLAAKQTGEALNAIRGLAPDRVKFFKGPTGVSVRITRPHDITGSEPEARDADPEDALTATGGALGPQAAQERPSKITAAAPQSLAKPADKLQELLGQASGILQQLMGGEQVDTKHIIDDLKSAENQLKSKAAEDPTVKNKLAELSGLKDEIESRSVAREWLEIFESMCINGI
jgi:hypothetical protein